MSVAHISDDMCELFEAITGIDTDHPDCAELLADWVAEYDTDLAIEKADW